MLKVERISVMNMENAIRGARNPLNSWDRMDSYYDEDGNFVLGENDLYLAVRIEKAGSDGVVLCFGSLYTIGDIKNALN